MLSSLMNQFIDSFVPSGAPLKPTQPLERPQSAPATNPANATVESEQALTVSGAVSAAVQSHNIHPLSGQSEMHAAPAWKSITSGLLHILLMLWQAFINLLAPLLRPSAAHGSVDLPTASSRSSTIRPTTDPPPAENAAAEQLTSPKKRASKLEYKLVKEVWSKSDVAYKLVEEVAEAPVGEYDEYLFVVRTRNAKQPDKTVIHIDIKSVEIRDVLRRIFANVRAVSLKEERPSIEQTYLFYFLEEIQASAREDPGAHLPVLVDYLRAEYASLTQQLQSLLVDHEITFELLWTLFKPNSDIFALCPGTGAPRCIRCHFSEEGVRDNGLKCFRVEGHYFDSDGETFGKVTGVLLINEFRGRKKIASLSAYPLAHHPRPMEMHAQLVKCGRQFVTLTQVCHRDYEGKTFYHDDQGQRVIQTIDKSRIMVDAAFFRKCNPGYRGGRIEPVTDFSITSWIDSLEGLLSLRVKPQLEGQEASLIQAIAQDQDALTAQDMLICSPTVLGYSLQHKKWLTFAVASVRDINWDESSFAALALPSNITRAVQALSRANWEQNLDASPGIVEGKGQGTIILLHGPPGVGKTLTAETISEHEHRPLLTISAGDLGTNSHALTEKLSDFLTLASRWRAALLLDEADVFLEQRTSTDLHRNGLVAIFLRLLEYFPGLLFLTTNRVREIDEAMASRIQLSLKYPDLDESARRKVWESQLARATTKKGPAVYEAKDLTNLVRKTMNGREITNIVSNARAMAEFDDELVTVTHLVKVTDLYTQFQADFRGAGVLENQNSYV